MSSPTGNRIAETEIDIVAVSRQAENYLIGECKFKGRPFRYSEYLDTREKLKPQQEKASFYYALFSESGFDERIIEEAKKEQRLYLYSLKNIVNYKGSN